MANPSDYSSLAESRRPQSRFRFPTLMNALSGHGAKVEQDALGRALVRNHERSNKSNLRFPSNDGVSRPKGPESYSEEIFDAQGQEGMSPEVRPGSMPALSPQDPGGIGGLTEQDYMTYLPETKGRRPPSARLQALAAIRKNPNAFRGA